MFIHISFFGINYICIFPLHKLYVYLLKKNVIHINVSSSIIIKSCCQHGLYFLDVYLKNNYL